MIFLGFTLVLSLMDRLSMDDEVFFPLIMLAAVEFFVELMVAARL